MPPPATWLSRPGRPLTRSTRSPAATQVASPEGVLNHAYDPATGRLTRTWTDSNDTTYDYDKQGRLWKVIATKLNGQTLATPQTTVYTYDAAGNLDLKSFDNGTTATSDDLVSDYDYTSLNQLDTLSIKQSTATLFDQDYDYTSDGQKDKVTEHRYANGSATETTLIDWSYDYNGRLTQESYDSSDNAKDYTAVYGFDLAGNRVSKTQAGYQAASTTTSFNDRNETVSTTTDGVTTAYHYDANGSLLTRGSDSFAWDLRGRMKSATVNGTTTTYRYDEDGVRVAKKVGTAAERTFVQDKLNPSGYAKPIEEKVNGTVDTSYVLGASVLGQADTSHGYLSLIQDGRGYTRAVLSGANAHAKTAQRHDRSLLDRRASSSPSC